jgi:hypothetical protein
MKPPDDWRCAHAARGGAITAKTRRKIQKKNLRDLRVFAVPVSDGPVFGMFRATANRLLTLPIPDS